MAENGDWHLDKKVPVGLAVALVGQTVLAIWWLATLSQRVDVLEHEAMAAVPRLESVIRLEMQASEIKADVTEIKSLVNEIHRPRQ